MGALSALFATAVPTNSAVPISDGSGSPDASLDAWVSDGSGGSGDLQTQLDALSTTHGAIIFRGASAWQALEPGTPGGFLETNGVGADPSWSLDNNPLVTAWKSLVNANGGTYEPDSINIANDLANQLQAATFFSKIIYFLPLLGGNLAAARCPLIDTLGRGITGSNAFVDGDFTQATGLQGDGSTKTLDLLIKANELGTGSNGGIGYLVSNILFTGGTNWLIGSGNTANTDFFGIYGDASISGWGFWGASASKVINPAAGAATNGDFYIQRASSTSRELFKDGTSVDTDTSSDGASGAGDRNIFAVGYNPNGGGAIESNNLCQGIYLTDGTLTSLEASDLHNLLQTYLIAATGR